MLMLGITLARHMSMRAADIVLAAAALFTLGAAVTGLDTLAVPLFVLFAAICWKTPRHRPLYASTFLLALGLELWGTWLGNWTWSRHVPLTSLVTTNPPGVSGAFYATLDSMVAAAAVWFSRGIAPEASAAAPVGELREAHDLPG
jgi:hypothetical protein